MDTGRVTQIAYDQMRSRPYPEREEGYILYHGQRVAALSLLLNQHMGAHIDEDILYAGALLHDVGKGLEPHSEMGAVLVQALLKEECTGLEIEEISRIVREHNQRRSDGCSIQAKIVQDADVLDHVGAMGLWLKLLRNVNHERTIGESMECYASSEVREGIARMRDSLNFDLSRSIFDERVAFEDRFFERFQQEVNGGF